MANDVSVQKPARTRGPFHSHLTVQEQEICNVKAPSSSAESGMVTSFCAHTLRWIAVSTPPAELIELSVSLSAGSVYILQVS